MNKRLKHHLGDKNVQCSHISPEIKNIQNSNRAICQSLIFCKFFKSNDNIYLF